MSDTLRVETVVSIMLSADGGCSSCATGLISQVVAQVGLEPVARFLANDDDYPAPNVLENLLPLPPRSTDAPEPASSSVLDFGSAAGFFKQAYGK